MRLGFPVLALLFSAFVFWGVSAVSDQKLAVTAGMLAELKQLKPGLVFREDTSTFYTGIRNPAERARADADFAALIDTLVNQLPQHPYRSFVEQQIKKTYSAFRVADTEDRERAIGYFQKILKTVGADKSGRFLNILLYGPILGRLVSK